MRQSIKRRYRWNSLKCLQNLMLLIAVFVSCWFLFSSPTGAGTTPENVIIRSGDNLWTVAVRVRPQEDPRKTVESIRYANQLKSLNVTPGQMIVIP